MDNTIKTPQKSRVSPKNPQNTTGLTDRTPTNQNKALLSRIAGDFGKISQNDANFAAQIVSLPVQKISFLGGVG
ncbi:MAG: hypothetical protein O9287_21250 [Microcystis sp. LE17-20D]|jgi:hypothetical protein|nr:hypothetical protein [Microcystis sp. LE17-20D]MCZ8068377.1 hypothetical protein [Microcystis sp. LE17-20D]MCZ8162411.1 hypothetical protein [Microcystis sp. LE19-196.1B]